MSAAKTKEGGGAKKIASMKLYTTPENLSSRFRTILKELRKNASNVEPMPSQRRYCGKCEYGYVIENGRARPCECRSGSGIGMRQDSIDALLKRHRAGMPRKLQRVNAHTFLVRPGHEHIKPALDKYIRDLGQGKRYGFFIFGEPGVGKSFAAAYIVNMVRINKIMTSVMVNFSRLLSAYRSTFHDAEENKKLVSVMYDSPLLAIDDLGMEQRVSENPEVSWAVSEFYKVIDYRRDEEMPTIITSNRTVDELKDRLGEPIMKRIADLTLRLDIHPPEIDAD